MQKPPGSTDPLTRARALGRAGEAAAARMLEARGWRVVGRGFLGRRGELDLICRRGDRLLVVEVKTRSRSAFGAPADAVTGRKRRALRAAVAEYRALTEWRGSIGYAVVGLVIDGDGRVVESELIDDVY